MKKAPMGWNSWDCYGAAVTEDIVRKNAEYMSASLKQYGWEYIVVDIQWYEPNASSNEYHPFSEVCMDEYGRLLPAENRFPSAKGGKGFKPLADYIHSLGLKFGIHIMRGIPRQAVHSNLPIKGTDKTARQIAKTASICYWNTDMYGVDTTKQGAKEYYDSIFELYASWGVDFIKCDDICRELPREEEELIMISDSLRNCNRDMIFSVSPGPALLEKAQLYKDYANMWRITDDFWDEWVLLYNMFERAEKWSIHSGNGHWPDADMLPVGALRQCYDENGWTRFTPNEQITMITLWSIMRSPLMIGGELTKNDEFTLKLLTNDAILKMHECSRNAHEVWRKTRTDSEVVLWTASCVDGGNYACIFNIGENKALVSVDADELELNDIDGYIDLWTGNEVNEKDITVNLEPHSAKAFYVK